MDIQQQNIPPVSREIPPPFDPPSVDSFEPPSQTAQIERTDRKRRLALKHWAGVVLLGFVAALVIWGLIKIGFYLRGDKKPAQNSSVQTQGISVGGDAPEETIELFLAALEKNDAELASEYFVAHRRPQWHEALESIKHKNALRSFVRELRFYQSRWERAQSEADEVRFQYSIIGDEAFVELAEGLRAQFPSGQFLRAAVLRHEGGVWKLVSI